jgi:hypothetical protein
VGPFRVSLLHATPSGEVELAKHPFKNNIGTTKHTTLEKALIKNSHYVLNN